MKYFRFQPDMYAETGVTEEPSELASVSFLRGVPLERHPTESLQFIVSNTPQVPPRHFSEISIPVWSTLMRDTIMAGGASNFDSYTAMLISKDRTMQWGGFHAVNILGLLDCVDLTASKYDVIMEQPNGIPFVKFDYLVIDSSRTAGLHLFRLANEPGLIVVSEQIISALRTAKPADGWGISIFPVDLS